MLRSLSIRDFVTVDRVDLEFAPGFTVLTGETGAGKSILIDALAMVIGERGDALTVRKGAERAEISAEFDASEHRELARWLGLNELAQEEGMVLMRRLIDASGRSRAFINGRVATLAQLREAGEFLVDIHGQHQHQSLLRSDAQRELLDAYGGLEEMAGSVASTYREWQQARERRIAFEREAASFAAERDQLEWQVRELGALNLMVDEWQTLTAEHTRLAHAASLIETAKQGVDALSEGEDSSLSRVNGIVSRLEDLADYDPRLREILEVLEPAQIQLQEAVYALRRYGERLELDPQRLSEIERRIEAVHSAARKYRLLPEELPETLEKARARLSELEAGGDAETMREKENQAHTACMKEARALSVERAKAAKKLSDAVTGLMQRLGMTGATFEVVPETLAEVGTRGLERIEFRVSSHKGMVPQPLARVASGGELSRVSLAVQTAASQVAHVPTLIFDEVDAGIGGRVAEIVGNMLKQLGKKHQVMCITHLPQVAAAADHQWRVTKNVSDGAASSSVTALDPRRRIDEIARMLAGVKITEATREHAAEMLKGGERGTK